MVSDRVAYRDSTPAKLESCDRSARKRACASQSRGNTGQIGKWCPIGPRAAGRARLSKRHVVGSSIGALLERTTPRLHPGITQEVAPNATQRRPNTTTRKREFTRRCLWRLGSSLDLQRAHNPKVAGSNPAPATNGTDGLAAAIANPSCCLLLFCSRSPACPRRRPPSFSAGVARRLLRTRADRASALPPGGSRA